MHFYVSHVLKLRSSSMEFFKRMSFIRFPIIVGATFLFMVGSYWSFQKLGISAADFKPVPLCLLASLLPVSLLYGGVGLVLLGRCIQTPFPLGRATIIATYASLAEALPIPGGAIVRTGALVTAGAPVGRSTVLVLASAILWIGLAAVGAAYALYQEGILGLSLILPGSLAVGGVLVWLLIQVGWKITVLTIFHRLCGIALMAVKLKLAFDMIGVDLPLVHTLPFAFTSIAGSAASIAPAGLGISEGLSALIANLTTTTASAAFLAVALNRLVGLGLTALAAMAFQLGRINAGTKAIGNG